MCREILNTCVRNTEEAENAQNDAPGGNGRGIGKGVWGMIEDSSLARSIRLTEGKQASLFVLLSSKTSLCNRTRRMWLPRHGYAQCS